MTCITCGKPLIQQLDFFTVDGRRIAVVMSRSVQISMPITRNPQHLRVFLRHPYRTSAGRCRQENRNSILIQRIDYTIQPFPVVFSFLRLQHSPRENTHRHNITAGLLHQFNVLLQYLRIMKPLFRVIIRPVQQSTCKLCQHVSLSPRVVRLLH
ncbi:hypothetical protein D3C80_1279970 [compost metagenome]